MLKQAKNKAKPKRTITNKQNGKGRGGWREEVNKSILTRR